MRVYDVLHIDGNILAVNQILFDHMPDQITFGNVTNYHGIVVCVYIYTHIHIYVYMYIHMYIYIYVKVSWNRGGTPKIIVFWGMLHDKQSILGIHHLWKTYIIHIYILHMYIYIYIYTYVHI